MLPAAQAIADHPWFGRIVTLAIFVAGVVVGLETDPGIVSRAGALLDAIDHLVLGIFLIEAVVKLAAAGPRGYFADPWNLFDASILAVAFMPFDAHYVAVLRLARLLRFLRLVRALPKLQILVGALLKSIPSMGYVGLLLGILFYVYAVSAVFLFGENDPVHFGNLPIAVVSLFRVVTGDGWTDLMYTQMYSCAGFGYGDHPERCVSPVASPVVGAVFFCSFVLIGAMVILNLFIGVIMNGMDEAKQENEDREAELRGDRPPEPMDELQAVERELSELTARIARLHHVLSNTPRR